ncbi:MAG TPA: secretin N-terminal domain-containing protein [Caulobacteraceae bacterium]
MLLPLVALAVQPATTSPAAEASPAHSAAPTSPPNVAPAPPAPFSWFPTATAGGAPGAAQPPASPGLAPRSGEVLEIVLLKYADVSEIVGILTGSDTVKPNDGFTPQEPNFGSSGLQLSYGGGGPPQAPIGPGANLTPTSTEALGRSVDGTIGVDRRLNAIVLRGTPERVAEVKGLIAELDVPVPSVILETEFVELTESGARNLGLDFNNANNQIATAAYSFSSGFPGVANTPRGGGVSVNLQAALYAQIAKGEGRIVSKPRVAAPSGGAAKIVTGDALPILTSIALSGVNAVQQQVQYVNVGVTLQIAPRVSSDGFVTSHVYAVVSTVTGYSQGYPTISQREASTTATVRDGETFVIGGLTQDSRISNQNKLPLLGELPVLGQLLNTKNATHTKTDLYIVVTPHVVRSGGTAPATGSPSH